MSILQSYPQGTPKNGDYIIGTSMPPANSDEMPTTRNFTVDSIVSLSNAPNVVTSKTTITTEQLKASGNSPVTIVDLADNQVADVISVIIKVNNQSAANKLTFADPLTIEPASNTSPSYRYLIPVATANIEVSDEFYKPALEAGYSNIGPLIGDVRFKSSVTSSNPVETGTATTTIDIYLTYRLIKAS